MISLHLLLSGILSRRDGGLRGLLMLAPRPRLFFRLVPLLWHHGLGCPGSSRRHGLRGSLGAVAIRDGTGRSGTGDGGGLWAPVFWRHFWLRRRRPKRRLGHVPVPGTGGHRLNLPGCRNIPEVFLHLLIRAHHGTGRQPRPGHAAVPGAGFHLSFGDGGRDPRGVFYHAGIDQVGPHQVGPAHVGALIAGSPG
jgi:hypothetical protein